MVALPIIFNPNPEAAAAILADLDDCSLSFSDLAKKHGTNSEALALWLSTDEITQRIDVTANAMARRVRTAATSRLPIAARAICRIVESYDGARDQEQPPLDPASPTYLADMERRRRRDDSTRRACYLLLRLATFFFPHTPPSPRSPGRGPEALRGGEGSASVHPTHPTRAPDPSVLSVLSVQSVLSAASAPSPDLGKSGPSVAASSSIPDPTSPSALSAVNSSPSVPTSVSSAPSALKSPPIASFRDGDDLYESLLAPDGTVDPTKFAALKDQFLALNINSDEALAALATLAPSTRGPTRGPTHGPAP